MREGAVYHRVLYDDGIALWHNLDKTAYTLPLFWAAGKGLRVGGELEVLWEVAGGGGKGYRDRKRVGEGKRV